MPSVPPAEPPADDTIVLQSRIPRDAHGLSLLEHLRRRFPYQDDAGWRAELAAGRLTLDGAPAHAGSRLRGGETLRYTKRHHEPRVATDLRVVHDDADLLVVDKPAHLPVHADGPFVRHTLVHMLRTRLGLPHVHLVHRLDRETSGLMVVPRTAVARAELERQFRAGSVRKVYLAIVAGRVEADFAVAAPIGHHATSTIALRRSAAADAKDPRPARTEFRVVRVGGSCSLLRAEPHTGRTHQIRVHLEHAGHPLLGDKLYGAPDAHYLDFVARVKAGADAREVPPGTPDRQLLHACELVFVHPGSGREVTFGAPPPADFTAWQP